MDLSKHVLAVALAVATLGLSASAAGAQNAPPPPAAPAQPGPAANIPEQKLDAAAAALQQVTTVRDNYEQRIAQAVPADKEKIAAEANNALVKAATDQGISVEEFNSIVVIAQNDPNVRRKILRRIQPKD